ncbi:peroxisome- protein [Lobosporangium transversale]|uniref:Integral peroxisomal membrane peroxin-domain-containing protein n=1 Tax=Lobosporangium transversale TaxID=64571 RepID=A0A1Y2G747_9FUNG|nr:integral peroxisomal membrane peroxin-domain-containing protein [Lobosporangium transversale]KAF9917968.1 peroxisome- protein [Lobosporangium transversale]ORY99627.1 integral peroxisomal membrane peroxin-domain-containing protein [Lobosporangium transversale]|eukprot:XP_021875922.1 integral peroxisomal membrane peroxin-domain-containing protein [Lobosporangium transversale]
MAATVSAGDSVTVSSASSRRNVLISPANKIQPSPPLTEFFSASTPVPASVTLLLSYTSPAIHVFHRLLQLLTWTSDRSVKSFLLLFAWWGICLGTETFLIYGLHGALILYIGHLWINSRKATKIGSDIPQSPATPPNSKISNKSNASLLSSKFVRQPTTTQLEQAATLREIQEILDHWAAWHRTLDKVETYLNWSDRSRTRLVLFSLVVTYVPWLILNYFIPMRFIAAVVGSVAICWCAPWFAIIWAVLMKLQAFSPLLQLIPYWPYRPEVTATYRKKRRVSVKDIISRAIGQRKKSDSEGYKSFKTSTGYDIEEDHATMYYKFVLYENQRWWLGLEWTPMMLPNDRSPWTDDHLEPTQSKSSFQLPPPHIAHEAIPGQPNKVLRKSQEWRWLDPHWRLKLGTDCDADGWEYANNHWKNWTGKRSRGLYTRRRAWERTAKLIDQREIVSLEDVQDELSSEQGGESENEEEEEEEEEEEVAEKEQKEK